MANIVWKYNISNGLYSMRICRYHWQSQYAYRIKSAVATPYRFVMRPCRTAAVVLLPPSHRGAAAMPLRRTAAVVPSPFRYRYAAVLRHATSTIARTTSRRNPFSAEASLLAAVRGAVGKHLLFHSSHHRHHPHLRHHLHPPRGMT